ncbi:hypothetical protein KP509_1Z054100 [Ceratopteris richardii]|nr:hypothetical protein KP509_1Z054100 [Ceratopteris richardii]
MEITDPGNPLCIVQASTIELPCDSARSHFPFKRATNHLHSSAVTPPTVIPSSFDANTRRTPRERQILTRATCSNVFPLLLLPHQARQQEKKNQNGETGVMQVASQSR